MTDDITESYEAGVDLFVRPTLTPSHQDNAATHYPGRNHIRPAALQAAPNPVSNEISALC